MPAKSAVKGLELVLKKTHEQMEHNNFCLEHPSQENGTTLLEVPFLLEIFHKNDPKSHVPFTF